MSTIQRNNSPNPHSVRPQPQNEGVRNSPLQHAAIPAALTRAFQGASAQGNALIGGDKFRAAAQNIFENLRRSLPPGGQRLLSNPSVQQALGGFNPQGILGRVRQEAQKMASFGESLQGTKTLWQGRAEASKGKDRSFVDAGLAGASGQGPLGLNIEPKKSFNKEYTVSDATKGKIDKAGQFLDKGGKILSQVDDIAQKLGINTTFYDKTKSVSTDKTLWGDVNGPNFVGAHASAQSNVKVGLTGIEASGRAEAGIEARVGVSGRKEGKYGVAEGSASAQVSAKASADGKVSLGPNGLTAEGNLYAGVMASAEASGRLVSKPIATIGGEPINLSVEGKAKVEAGAYAYANGKAQATWNPPALAVEGKAGAFAGARATAEANVGVGPLKAGVKAEGWAGIGFEASAKAGYKDGKLNLGFNIGAALGIGGKIGFDVTLDVGAVGRAITGVAKDIGKAAEKVGKGIVDTAKKVGGAVVDTFKKVGESVGNFFKKIKIF